MTSFSPVRPSYLSLLFFSLSPTSYSSFCYAHSSFFRDENLWEKWKESEKKAVSRTPLSLSRGGKEKRTFLTRFLLSFLSSFSFLLCFENPCTVLAFFSPFELFSRFISFLFSYFFSHLRLSLPLSFSFLFLWPPPLLDGKNERRDKSVQGSRPSQGPNFQWEWFCGGDFEVNRITLRFIFPMMIFSIISINSDQ